jgi:2-oxoglutarate ferredoxin oxidoreductase subunit alpha
MRSLLINELNVNPQKMVPVLNYDGMPITAHTIISLISKNLSTALNGSTSKILS